MKYTWIEILEGNCKALEDFFKEIKLQKKENVTEWQGTSKTEKIEFGDVEFEIIKAYHSLEHGLLYGLYIEPRESSGYYELRAMCPDYLKNEVLTGIEDLFLGEGEKQTSVRELLTKYRQIKRDAIKDSKAFTEYLTFSSLYVQ
ncbi:MAG: hypothetical protein Q8R18_03925 [bacterium]|nr:hypothetical protein [bacterium]